MKSSLLYDVKRSLIRPSILAVLILFTALGLVAIYGTYPVTANMFRPVDGVAIIASGNPNNCIVIGGVFNRRGEAVDATITFIANNSRIYSRGASGVYIIENTSLCRYNITEIEINTRMLKFNITKTREISKEFYDPVTGALIRTSSGLSINGHGIAIYGSIDGAASLDLGSVALVFKMFINDVKRGIAKIYIFTLNTSSHDLSISKPIKLDYGFSTAYFPGLYTNVTDLPGLEYRGVITVDDRVEEITIDLDLGKQFIDFRIPFGHTSDERALPASVHMFDAYTISINYGYMISTERAYIEYLLGSTGIELFMFAFPIAVLYLAHILIAKPRGSGALEFILVRPITRTDLYISRYAAGAIAIAIATAVFVFVLAVFYPVVLGVSLDLWSYMLLYVGVTASLVTFYTICCAIATVLRPGLYLAIAITIYIFLTIVWSVVIVIIAFITMGSIPINTLRFMELIYVLSYLNPLNFVEFARYYILLYYGATPEITTVNAILCITSVILWNAVFFTLGLNRFKKCILTS